MNTTITITSSDGKTITVEAPIFIRFGDKVYTVSSTKQGKLNMT